jgi:ferredoxin-NADP reductase
VTDADALLYLPGKDPDKLRLAVRIPALSPGWQQSFRDLLDAAGRGGQPAGPEVGTEPSAGPGPAWAGFRPLRVTRLVRETSTVESVYLEPADGSTPPPALAGQYLTLRVAGAGQPAPVRSYSLSSAPGASAYRISVKREPHGVVSGYLSKSLRAGATIDVAAPRGEFTLGAGSGPVLLISAGIGVTPVLAMLHQLAADRSEREIWWIYGARGPREQPLAAEAQALLAGLPNGKKHVYYSQATAAERRAHQAEPGHITQDTLAALTLPASADAYICGPAAFMTSVQDTLAAIGVDAARIHTELFAALPSVNPGLTHQSSRPPHPPAGPAGTGPLVTFARSGIATPFTSGRDSILELAEACDVPTRWSCRTGVCHTCVTPLLSGDVGYDPDPLEPPPDGQVLICCSRPRADVILDM